MTGTRRRAMPLLLLALAASCSDERVPDTRPAATTSTTAAPAAPWLREITQEAGLDFTFHAGATGRFYMREMTGAGCALFDADGDGDLDVYFTNGNDEPPRGGRSATPTHRFFRQEPGLRFVDATLESGLLEGGYGQGVAVGDVDDDGDLDLYVANEGPDRLYVNDGSGRFHDATEAAGIRESSYSTCPGFFDADNDGDLDLYVATYSDMDPEKKCYPKGELDYCGPRSLRGVHDLLFRNEGGGVFTDVSASAGIAGVELAGFQVLFDDINDDGLMDVYVANDGYENNAWINQGDWTFRDQALSLGIAVNELGAAEASMGGLLADLDGDSLLDFFLTHLRAETNTFYRNLGAGRGYADETIESGLGPPSTSYTGWGTAAIDFENDGDLDVLVVNGRVQGHHEAHPGSTMPEPWTRFPEPNHLYVNGGGGKFRLDQAAAGDFGVPIENSRGVAIGDVDRDGDLDVLVSNVEGQARLYLNEAPKRGHWLMVRAMQTQPRRDSVNSHVVVTCGGRRFIRGIQVATGMAGSCEPVAHFGLGDCDTVESIEVRWPDGVRETFPGGAVDRVVVVERTAARRRS